MGAHSKLLTTSQKGKVTVQTKTCTRTFRPAADAAVVTLPDLPDPHHVAAADERAMSKILFGRLALLNEGTPEYQYVRNTLVEVNLTLVKFVARRYHVSGEWIEDVIQVGTIGLIKAIDRFDLAQGNEFASYALPTIGGEIKRFFRDTTWALHVPRGLQERHQLLALASDDLAIALGRAPTLAELADHLDLTVAEVREGQAAANAHSTLSIDATSQNEDDVISAIVGRLGATDPRLDLVVNVESLKPLLARLDQRERDVLSMRFGAEMTQSDIGAVFGYSQMQVFRMLNRILTRLRSELLAQD